MKAEAYSRSTCQIVLTLESIFRQNGLFMTGAGLERVTTSEPGRDMIEEDLLNEGGPVSAVIPQLEDQDQPGDEGAGPREGHIELGGQGG